MFALRRRRRKFITRQPLRADACTKNDRIISTKDVHIDRPSLDGSQCRFCCSVYPVFPAVGRNPTPQSGEFDSARTWPTTVSESQSRDGRQVRSIRRDGRVRTVAISSIVLESRRRVGGKQSKVSTIANDVVSKESPGTKKLFVARFRGTRFSTPGDE